MVYQLQKQKKVYYVKSLSKYDNPRHAQVWGYENSLHSCLIEKKSRSIQLLEKIFKIKTYKTVLRVHELSELPNNDEQIKKSPRPGRFFISL